MNDLGAFVLNLADEPPSAKREAGDGLRIICGSQFVREFAAPDWAIDGLTPRGCVQAWTALTGHGKTAVATLATVCILTGTPFAGREVERGAVLVLCGENPTDYQARLLATLQMMGLEPDALANLAVVDSVFSIAAAQDEIATKVASYGPLVTVIVDTAAAFFDGDSENDNVQQARFASSLRALSKLPGKPCVIVLAHPVKNAHRDNLLPRGGGAFLNEIDSNLTLWTDGITTMHWQGKIRGPSFDPLTFELVPVTLNGVTDRKGRPVQSVAARHAEAERAAIVEQTAASHEDTLLRALLRKPGAPLAALALACGWTSGPGVAQKSRVHRTLEKLRSQDLAAKGRAGAWALTKAGRKEAEALL